MFIWTVSDIIGLVIFCILVAVVIFGFLPGIIKRAIRNHNCQHPRYFETMACHAVCTDCGKDLGFIGEIRKQKERKER